MNWGTQKEIISSGELNKIPTQRMVVHSTRTPRVLSAEGEMSFASFQTLRYPLALESLRSSCIVLPEKPDMVAAIAALFPSSSLFLSP